MTKVSPSPRLLLALPDITLQGFNPTEYVGREVLSSEGKKRGVIKSIDTGRNQIRVKWDNKHGGSEGTYMPGDIHLIAVMKEEFEGMLESIKIQAKDIEERLKYMADKEKDIFPDKEYEAAKLLDQLKNTDSEEDQIQMLLNSEGF